MGVPGGIEDGGDRADAPVSWTEKFVSPGPELKALGDGETLEGNPDGTRPVVGGTPLSLSRLTEMMSFTRMEKPEPKTSK